MNIIIMKCTKINQIILCCHLERKIYLPSSFNNNRCSVPHHMHNIKLIRIIVSLVYHTTCVCSSWIFDWLFISSGIFLRTKFKCSGSHSSLIEFPTEDFFACNLYWIWWEFWRWQFVYLNKGETNPSSNKLYQVESSNQFQYFKVSWKSFWNMKTGNSIKEES